MLAQASTSSGGCAAMPEAEETVNAGYVPEITWNDHVVWRGELRAGRGRDAAYVAARCMADRISPAVTVGDRPALRVDLGDPVAEFRLGYSDCDYRSESMTALQRAAQVFAEMSCGAAPAVEWEPMVVSGGEVIWRARREGLFPCENADYAQEHAFRVLYDLKPAAIRHWEDRNKWESHIEHLAESGTETIRLRSDPWPTKNEAWQRAAQILAAAEATIQQAELREPLIATPEAEWLMSGRSAETPEHSAAATR